ncbi:hypothetical protein [Anditalea andensis]|uniref:Uncharacterized protein n=1 Tax=Anditalea andensis TaxID=1048983 RepID=A0A074KSG0_9BACT|nr:hypothetical protein [Anditalea andensis]KEO71854.1 hypothetical protein EL17_21090 [Anditalea andensis]
MKASNIYSHLVIKSFTQLLGRIRLCLFALHGGSGKTCQPWQLNLLTLSEDYGQSVFDILFERKPKNPI